MLRNNIILNEILNGIDYIKYIFIIEGNHGWGTQKDYPTPKSLS
jgi:hypothetical protein